MKYGTLLQTQGLCEILRKTKFAKHTQARVLGKESYEVLALESNISHNSACAGWGKSLTWCVDSLLQKNNYAYVNADASSLPMHFDGFSSLLKSALLKLVS